jgi:uncharacterized protein (TIGR02594 family)
MQKQEKLLDPPWLSIALAEFSQHIAEDPGPRNNPRILEYIESTGLNPANDEIPWCASFVTWCMRKAGYGRPTGPGLHPARARSWLEWGVPIDEPRRGCITVLSRGDNPRQGHVGFFLGRGVGPQIIILGGNQHDCVCEATFPGRQVLGYRWCSGEPSPVRVRCMPNNTGQPREV